MGSVAAALSIQDLFGEFFAGYEVGKLLPSVSQGASVAGARYSLDAARQSVGSHAGQVDAADPELRAGWDWTSLHVSPPSTAFQSVRRHAHSKTAPQVAYPLLPPS